MRLIICEEIAQTSLSLDGLAPHIGEDHEHATWLGLGLGLGLG